MRQALALFLLLATAAVAPQRAHAEDPGTSAGAWETARILTRDGYKADEEGRHEEATSKLKQALALRPNHPGLIYALAQTTAATGDADAAFGWLERYASLGLTTDLTRADALTPLHTDPRFAALAARVTANQEQQGEATRTFTASQTLLLVEGIAYDAARDRFFLSSLYERKIVSSARDGTLTPFADQSHGLWSPTGMTVDAARGHLVVASAATPQTPGITEADQGKSAVHIFDLETGAIVKKWQFDGNQRWFGDVVPGPDGTLYISDSLQNEPSTIPQGAGAPEALVSHIDWPSPQGIALSGDGAFLYLADYAMGLFRINLETKTVLALAPSADLAPYGIDGLYFHKGALIAVQNGTNPQRVLRITLNETGDKVLSADVLVANHPDFLEPTLGVITGDTFHFIANSGWPHFGKPPEDPEALRKELPPTVVLEIDLAKSQ